jgi:hypothetical protein
MLRNDNGLDQIKACGDEACEQLELLLTAPSHFSALFFRLLFVPQNVVHLHFPF